MAGTSYTRQSTIADGNIISASLFNNEFNQILNAFAYASTGTTGHQHDGGAGEGGNIAKIGDQDFLNKIEVDSTNNRIGLFVQVSSGTVEQVRIQDGAIVPVTDSDVDLGTTSVRFKDAFVDSATVTGAVSAATVTSSGTTNIVTGVVTGDLTLTGADYNIVFDASASELKFNDNAELLIGTGNDLKIYHDGSNTRIREQGTGILYITADNQTSMGSSNGAASFVVEGANGTTFFAGGTQKMFINSDGVNFPDDAKLNLGNSSDLQIFHDGSNSRITDTGTGNLYLTGANNISLLSNATTYGVFGTSVDLYYSNSKKFETTSAGVSITGNATVSGAVGAQTFNAAASIDTPAIEVTTLKARDGSAAGSIANSTGVVTLGSAILTTADINGGTADNVVIGGSTAAAGTFTTLNATTVDTTNIEATNLKAKDGTSAGSIADSTGVVTLASSVLTTTDINGGTVDGATVGATTAAAGNFTTLGATGLISGTDLTLTDASPIITLSDTDGTDTFSRIRQVTGSLKIECRNNTGHGAIEFETVNSSLTKTRLKIGTNGDANFYDNDGSTVGMKWDASSARLGVGTSSPATAVDVAGKITTTEGIYLGGTGSANLFDDYEEGTFTPTLFDENSTDGNQADVGTTVGTYTKVGDLVTCVINLSNIDTSTNSMVSGQQLHIHGLPFTSRASRLVPVPLYCVQVNVGSSIVAPFGVFGGNGTFMQLRIVAEDGGTSALNVSAINNDTSDIHLAFSYHTDS